MLNPNVPAETVPGPDRRAVGGSSVERATPSASGRDLEQRLRELLASPKLLAAGRVNMFNLDVLRSRLGERWPSVRERVHSAAERILSRHLSPRDIYFRTADDEYILVFSVVEKQMAKMLCGKVVEELYKYFLGEEDLNSITVATAVGTFEGQLVYKNASLTDILKHVRVSAADRGDDERPNSEKDLDPSSGTTNGSGEDVSRYNASYRSRERIKGVYRPTWDVERKVISTYFYTPVRVYPDGSSVEGPVALDVVADPNELFEIDVRALTEAVETLDELFRNKFRLMVSIPICFETLSSKKQRMEYLAKCRFIPEHIRRFIQFEFLRFPLGIPNGRMTDLVAEMRPFCQGVFVRADFRQPRFAGLAGTGVAGVSVVIPGGRDAEARTMEDMNAFVSAAERAGLRSCAIGVVSTSLALAARGSGFSLIAGDLVGQADDIPQHMLRFGWRDLFLNAARS